MADEIEVKGLAELGSLLDGFSAKIERNVVSGALRAGAKIIEAEAKRLCPLAVGNLPKGHEPGELRDSIHVSMRTRRGVVTATIKAGSKKAYYAHMVEFGTALHFIKPKNRKSLFVAGLFKEVIDHPGAKRHPFMRPAIDGKKDEALQAIVDYMTTRIEKEAAK